MAQRSSQKKLAAARSEFLARWGALGPAWGVSRTMSQIHALLMVAPEAHNTDQIMEELQISRGNAHTNIAELCDWGLLRKVKRPGERKDYYEAEKDVWRVIQCITRARKRKELEPVLQTLEDCLEQTRGLKDAGSRAFREQLTELHRFAKLGDNVMRSVSEGRSSRILPRILRFLK
jgi:DNA-binding transcriptional regulator GbsR (MarR family)